MYFLHVASWVNIMFVKDIMVLYIGIIDLFSLLYNISLHKKLICLYILQKDMRRVFWGYSENFKYIHVHVFVEKEWLLFWWTHS